MDLLKIFRTIKKPLEGKDSQENLCLVPANAAQIHEKMMELVHPVIYSEIKPDRETLMYASIATTINIIIDDGRLAELYYKLGELFPEYDYSGKL